MLEIPESKCGNCISFREKRIQGSVGQNIQITGECTYKVIIPHAYLGAKPGILMDVTKDDGKYCPAFKPRIL